MKLFFRHLLPLLLLSLVSTCKTRPRGQIMLALDTDLAIPKDIKSIQVTVVAEDTGIIVWHRKFDDFPTERNAAGTRLPATIGFWAPEGSDRPIRIEIVARDQNDVPHVLPRIVTTIPDERTVTLPVRVEFLCYDYQIAPERDEHGNVKLDDNSKEIWTSTCGDGRVCKAGECVTPDVGSDSLPQYNPGDIFGGGTGKGDGICYDLASCLDEGEATDVDVTFVEATGQCVGTMQTAVSWPFNVALRTQGLGTCTNSGCYVVMDYAGAGGYVVSPPVPPYEPIILPKAVCERVASRKVVGVVAFAASKAPCNLKTASIPLCASYSSSGDGLGSVPDPTLPKFVASAQLNPISLSVSNEGVLWASQGNLDENGVSSGDGAVKFLPMSGSEPEVGDPKVIADMQRAPVDVAWHAGTRFALFTIAQGQNGGHVGFAKVPQKGSGGIASDFGTLVGGLAQPSGIASSPNGVMVFADSGSDEVHHVQTVADGDSLIFAPGAKLETYDALNPPGVSPHAVAVAQNTACFTYEATLMDGKGVVACSPTLAGGGALYASTQQSTPRSIVLNSSTFATEVYWANFGPSPAGAVLAAPIELTSQETLLDIDYPAGLALDNDSTPAMLYVTSRNAGQILRIDMTPGKGYPAEICVDGRKEVGAVAVDKDNLYWIELGLPKPPMGAIMKLSKSALQCRPR